MHITSRKIVKQRRNAPNMQNLRSPMEFPENGRLKISIESYKYQCCDNRTRNGMWDVLFFLEFSIKRIIGIFFLISTDSLWIV